MSAQPKIQLTEAAIQDLLYFHCVSKGHILVNPNSCVFGWESDFVSVTKNLMVHEFEIKISKSDFKADAKKEKSALMIDPVKIYYPDLPRHRIEVTVRRPNYFYYVVPQGMITPEEVPDYAGLIYACPWYDKGRLRIAKKVRRIHDQPIDQHQVLQLTRSVMYRYWRQRLKG